MKSEHQASRTLVKSPPELWAECSDAGSLARHIGEFGEIRITRLEPETSVCWEADHASGTVEIAPSGWGTRVTLTAQTAASEAGAAETGDPGAAEPGERAEPVAEVDPAPLQQAVGAAPETESDSVEEEIDATVEEATADPDPPVAADAGPAGGRWKRLIARTRKWFSGNGEAADPVTSEPEPRLVKASSPEPAPSAVEPSDQAELGDEAAAVDPAAVLTAALDSLGQAHHRPFSRA